MHFELEMKRADQPQFIRDMAGLYPRREKNPTWET